MLHILMLIRRLLRIILIHLIFLQIIGYLHFSSISWSASFMMWRLNTQSILALGQSRPEIRSFCFLNFQEKFYLTPINIFALFVTLFLWNGVTLMFGNMFACFLWYFLAVMFRYMGFTIFSVILPSTKKQVDKCPKLTLLHFSCS